MNFAQITRGGLALLALVTGSAALAADEPKPARRMQVTVLGPDERPLAGANIHVSVWTKEPFQANRDFVCDDRGQTSFDLPQQIEILRLWARHSGHVALFAQWWPDKEPAVRPIPEQFTFHLAQGTRIGGRVRNHDGEPVAGARVEVRLVERRAALVSPEPIPNIWLSTGEDAIKTDAAGRWSLDNAPAGDIEISLLLTHPQYVGDAAWGGLQKEQGIKLAELRDGAATIVMHRGVSPSGVVTDDEGKAVVGAVVVWGDDPYLEWGSQEVRTDALGRYKLPPQKPGPLTVTVVAPGFAPQDINLDLLVQVAADFRLERGKTLRIQFVDDAGAPVAGVGVGIESWHGKKALYNHKHPNVLETKIPRQADKNGLFEWTWAPSDEVKYSFYKEGFGAIRERSLRAGEAPLAVQLTR